MYISSVCIIMIMGLIDPLTTRWCPPKRFRRFTAATSSVFSRGMIQLKSTSLKDMVDVTTGHEDMHRTKYATRRLHGIYV